MRYTLLSILFAIFIIGCGPEKLEDRLDKIKEINWDEVSLYKDVNENPDKYKINATPDLNSPTKVYIPNNLDDAFIEMNKMLHPDFIESFKTAPELAAVTKSHFNLGRWMRNNWGLWGDSRLAKYFQSIGVKHPDDMAGILLTSFWRHLNKQNINLNKQVDYYKRFWEQQKKY